MFATLAAAKVAATEFFATDHRIAAVTYEVAGSEVRIGRSEVASERKCYCPGDCNCNAPAWMMRTVYCGCRQH